MCDARIALQTAQPQRDDFDRAALQRETVQALVAFFELLRRARALGHFEVEALAFVAQVQGSSQLAGCAWHAALRQFLAYLCFELAPQSRALREIARVRACQNAPRMLDARTRAGQAKCRERAGMARHERGRHAQRTCEFDRVQPACDFYPCDVLFIHRDADKEPHTVREKEIRNAVAEALPNELAPSAVCVIPVRMMEAWLLFDEPALRKAADNPKEG